MKSILHLGILIFLICSACQKKEPNTEKEKPEQVLLTGTIENHDGNSLKINDFMGKGDWSTVIPVQNGAFSMNLPLEKSSIKSITYATMFKSIFLQTGDTLVVSFNAAKIDSTFNYKGSLAKENNILDSLRIEEDKINYRYVYASELEDASRYLDSTAKANKAYLEKLTANNIVAEDFVDYTKASIDYKSAMYKLYIGARKDEQSENYYNFIDDLDLENEDYLNILNYRSFLNQYIETIANNNLKQLDSIKKQDPDALFDESLKVIQNLKNDKVRAYALYNAMNMRLRMVGLKNFEEYYNSFKAQNNDPKYAAGLKTLYEEKQRIAPGQPAPVFSLEDVNGNILSLDDFKGQYVYIDFWHPRCPQSAKELPYLLDLYADYEDNNIAFVSVSGNDDEQEWRNYVKDKKNIGISLRETKIWESKTYKDYQILSHPSFVLIDPNGKIVNAVAPKPSSEEIRETFDQFLK